MPRKNWSEIQEARNEGRLLGTPTRTSDFYLVRDATIDRCRIAGMNNQTTKVLESHDLTGVVAEIVSAGNARAADSRITLTRVAAVGMFAVAAPKRTGGSTGDAFVTITGPDFEWVIKIDAADTTAHRFVAHINRLAKQGKDT